MGPIKAGAATVAHLLLFPTKLRMGEFLVSSEARQLAHLQFYDQLLQRVSKNVQGVDVVRTEAHSLGNRRGGDAEDKCERLENLLREKECEAKELQRQLEEAKVAVIEANVKIVQEQLDEIHQLSLSSLE